MSRRAVGAALCAAAAIALVVAGFAPWWRVAERDDEAGLRANFSLTGGELCANTDRGLTCRDLSYGGRPGLRDDLFAWTGRLALAALLVGAVLAIVLAFVGGRRRAILRGLTASTAACAAALGAAAVTVEQLPLSGNAQLGAGLWAAILGAALAAAAAAWPVGAAGVIPSSRRIGLAVGVLALAVLAWTTIGLRAWWAGTGTFSHFQMSPLGIEACAAGHCTQVGVGSIRLHHLALLAGTAALSAALLVVATGLAVRALRGVAPRGWALATAILGGLAVAVGGVALAGLPRRGTVISPGGWSFLVAAAGLVAVALVSRRVLRWIDPVDASDEPGPRLVPFGLAPSGPKPVLAALGAGAQPPVRAPAPPNPYRPGSASLLGGAALPALAPAAPAPMPRRVAPLCPTCRSSTMWHGKRAAWWCTTCKHAL